MFYKHKYFKITTLTLLCLIFIKCRNNQLQNNNEIIYSPIGIIHSSFNTETGAPRQGILMPETKGEIEIFEPYREALQTLDEFEYIIVLYHFDKVRTWESHVNPPASTHEHDFGLFSTRSPKRPNPIGLSIVKLESINDGILHVRGVDAFEGTPVLDIKPYLPSVDCIKSQRNEEVEKELGHHDEIFITDSSFYR